MTNLSYFDGALHSLSWSFSKNEMMFKSSHMSSYLLENKGAINDWKLWQKEKWRGFVIMPGDSSALEDNYIINPPLPSSELYSPLSVIALHFHGSFQKDISISWKRNTDTSFFFFFTEATVLEKQCWRRAKKKGRVVWEKSVVWRSRQ